MSTKAQRLDAQFAEIWRQVRAAANAAAVFENNRLGEESARGLDCGFAWVVMDGNIPFARWARKQGISSKGHPSGQHIWYSKLHSVPTQSVSVHEAAAKVASNLLQQLLGTSLVHYSSRLD